jgi:glycosyltransferase involved in cell wall biosynthesis
MKLSLTVICGNVAPLMRRFFASFEGIADEIVVVRAIGNQQPDESLDIAKEHGAICGEYRNDPAHADWPHVDDFAAARNLAMRMATGDWCLWLDTDDLMEGDWSLMRPTLEECEKNGLPGLMLPYEVPDDGVRVMRERVWKRGTAKWTGRIHECLAFDSGENTKLAEHHAFSVLHAPAGKRAGSSNERNLRILESIPPEERTIGDRFHLFMSLRAVGRIEDGIAVGLELAKEPPDKLASPERYEILISLGQLAENPDTRHQFFLQSLNAAPDRREAYGELALLELNMGHASRMMAWIDAMHGLPDTPPAGVWNLRRRYWGWLGVCLKAMALRVNGQPEKADTIELNHFLDHGAKISLIHATRGRPKMAAETRKKWLDMAADANRVEHVFCLDTDDTESHILRVFRHVTVPGNGGSVAAWNAGAEFSRGSVVVQLSDDWEPFTGWDAAILDAIGDTSREAVLAIGDGNRTDDLLCMAICTRARLKKQGYFFHPDFFSVYSDNWFSHCAFRDGVVIDARDSIVFQHHHPAFDKGQWDAIYARSNAETHYKRGIVHFERLKAGRITSHDVHGWCNYRDFYTALARMLPDGATFVEIGSWMGQSIIHFAQRCQDLGKSISIHVVDTFQGEEGQTAHIPIVEAYGGNIRAVFENNIRRAGVEDMITIHVGDSAESAALFTDGSVDACYVDAAHEYEPVMRDLQAWIPKMTPRGLLSGHDYQHEPVRRAVDGTMAAHGWTVAVTGNVWVRQFSPHHKKTLTTQ